LGVAPPTGEDEIVESRRTVIFSVMCVHLPNFAAELTKVRVVAKAMDH
jgi:hypothetical protein